MKFSIRDLFLVTLIVAVCVAWWVDRSKLSGQIETLMQKVDESSGKVEELQGALEHNKQRAELMRDIHKFSEEWTKDAKKAREKYGVP